MSGEICPGPWPGVAVRLLPVQAGGGNMKIPPIRSGASYAAYWMATSGKRESAVDTRFRLAVNNPVTKRRAKKSSAQRLAALKALKILGW